MIHRLFIGSVAALCGVFSAFAGFDYQAEIDVSGYSGAALTDFPLLVRVSPTRIKDFSYSDCQPGGTDIRFFVSGSSQALDHEIETWDPSGESIFWVRVPSLSSSTKLAMKYGNAALVTVPDATNVWAHADGGYYGAVWHFNDTIVDGTENAVDAAKHLSTLCMDAVAKTGSSGVASERVSCAGVAGPARVNASTAAAGASAGHQAGNYFLVPSYTALGLGTVFTVSLWAKTDLTSAPGGIMSRKQSYWSDGGFGMYYDANALFVRFGKNGSSKTFNNMPRLSAGWTHLTLVCNDTSFGVYTNGVLHSTGTGVAASDNGTPLSIGSMVDTKCFTGAFDEMRFRSGAASADWIRAEHDSVASDGFLTYGAAVPLGNTVVVTGEPAEWGTPAPAYGNYTSYTGGQVVQFRASDDPFAVTADQQARFAGWKYFEADADGAFVLKDAAATNAWDYTHVQGATVKFAWQLKRRWKLTLATSGTGAADFLINGVPAVAGDNWVDETNAVVVTVVPQSGSRFVLWDDSLGRSATRTNELFAAMTMTACVRGADELAADSYVQDGLVFQLDGIENAGVGIHSTTATQWTDLVGNHPLAMPTLKFTWTWDANSWYVTASDSTAAGGPNVGPFDVDWGNMTLESCVNANTASRNDYLCYATTGAGEAKFVAGKSNSSLSFTAPGKDSVWMNNRTAGTCVATVRDGVSRVWQTPDGGMTGSTSSSAGLQASTLYVGCANTYYNDRFVGHFYGMRLYDRALSDHELRWNAFVDTARFIDPTVDTTGKTRVYVEALPLALGIAPTDKGLSEVTKGTSQTHTIADKLVTHPLDSARVADKNLGTGVRARYTGYVLSEDRTAPTAVPSSESVTFTTSARTASVSWLFDKEYDFAVSASAGGKVSIDGGTAVSSTETWVSAADADGVTLTAVPEAGYRFFSWKGDLKGVADASKAEITVTLDAPRTLQALFVPTGEGHEPVETAWKTTVKTGAWNDPANWSAGEMPSLGDTVYLTNSAATTVTLEQPIDVGELVIGGQTTLKVSNWFAQLKATRVRILDGGTITTVGGFTETQMSNRVWLVGTDLTIEAGGRINVKECGYGAGQGPTWALARAAGINGLGPSYGGFSQLPTYGSLELPTDPGSGGSSYAGGGAVLLDFTGTVTIDGTINADGEAGNSGYIQPGSTGGAVLIKCAKIAGSGTVSAGASTYNSRVYTHGVPTYCGGGGRIAVHYDPAAQDTASCTICFQARGGMLSLPTTPSRSDPETSGVGTLYFTDNRFLTGDDTCGTGWRLTGSWHSGVPLPSPLVLAGDRGLDRMRLEIPQADLDLRIGGDLTLIGSSYFGSIETGFVLGEGATLSVGGNLRVAGSRLELGEGGAVSVAGSLTQQTNALACLWGDNCKGVSWNGGAIVMRAAPTNGTEECGASVTVAGRWTVGTNAVVYPWCQQTNGAAVKLSARRFCLERGGRVDADERGFPGGYGPGIPPRTTEWISAAHGGLGSATSAATSNKLCAVYGDAKRPLEPGSGGNVSWASAGETGGGVVWIEATRDAVLNGILSANAVTNRYLNNMSGSSGGSIYVRARKIEADGLDASAAGGTSEAAPGAGGRIAFASARTVTNDVTTSVRCGTKYVNKQFLENGLAEPGTVEWTEIPDIGLSILVR